MVVVVVIVVVIVIVVIFIVIVVLFSWLDWFSKKLEGWKFILKVVGGNGE